MRVKKVEDQRLAWFEDPNSESGYYDWNTTTNKPTTRYYYDGQMSIEDDYTEDEGNDTDITATKHGIGARGIDYIEKYLNGTIQGCQFPVYDAHGNMVLTLSRSGSAWSSANHRAYEPWGSVRMSDSLATGAAANKQRYCANLGHVQDDESDLIYMRARYYEASTGRFVSEDPARDGGNWFSYCNNAPTARADFSGKWAHILIGAILGGIIAAINGSLAGLKDWQLTGAIVVGVIAGALSAATGAWVAELGILTSASGAVTPAGIMAGGAAGGAISNLISSLMDEIAGGKGVNWKRVGRAVGIGGTFGLVFGAVGASAQRNGEVAAAIAGINGDLWGSVVDANF